MTEQTKTSFNLRKAFDQGVAVAIDPANNVAIQQGGEAITNLNSYWLDQRCPVCSHTLLVN